MMHAVELDHYREQMYHEAVECLKHTLQYMLFGWIFLCAALYATMQGSWAVALGLVCGALAWRSYRASWASRQVLVKMHALPLWVDILCVMMALGAVHLVYFAFRVSF